MEDMENYGYTLFRTIPFCAAESPSSATLGHGATREMVGAAPVCPPERPRSGVSIRKGHVPQPQRRRFYALKCFYITHDAHLLTMDAPLQGDTGGHTGTAPTNLHQTPLPAIISCVCPSANRLPPTIPRVCLSANSSPATHFDGAPCAQYIANLMCQNTAIA